MPVYEYACPNCEAQRNDIRAVAERKDGPFCGGSDCFGIKMELILSPTPGIVKDPAVPRSNK